MSHPHPSDTAEALIARARDLGLTVGITSAEPPRRSDAYRQWLKEGHAGTMTYLNRSVDRRADPEKVLPGVKSIIVVAENYHTEPLPDDIRSDPARGIIASYAWGRDYHDVLLEKLETLAEFVKSITGCDLPVKCYVDTGHILERDFAEQAGLGFTGKNTMLIQPRAGSYYFLGEILTTLELEPTPLSKMPACGSCTRCLDVCPTHALPAEYILNSNLCISYLTIEYKGVIDRRLRPEMGNHIFGCDDCQTCCPWNRFSTPTKETAYHGNLNRKAPRLIELAELDETGFKDWFADSPVLRPKFSGLMRNVAIALGNWGSDEAVDALERLISLDNPLVRLHAAWALGQCRTGKARQLLRRMEEKDEDEDVRAEAADVLRFCHSGNSL